MRARAPALTKTGKKEGKEKKGNVGQSLYIGTLVLNTSEWERESSEQCMYCMVDRVVVRGYTSSVLRSDAFPCGEMFSC